MSKKPYIHPHDLRSLREHKELTFLFLLFVFVCTPLLAFTALVDIKYLLGGGLVVYILLHQCRKLCPFWYLAIIASFVYVLVERNLPSDYSALYVFGLFLNAVCLVAKFFFPSTLESFFDDPRIIDPETDMPYDD